MYIKTINEISTGNIVESNNKRIELVKDIQNSKDLFLYLDIIGQYLINDDLSGIKYICKHKLFFEEIDIHIDNIFKSLETKIKTKDYSIDSIINILEVSYLDNAHDGFLMSWGETLRHI
ncbi:hypothetical protein [Metaclostridioides mangenotii]|uniref:Uncharacterized protein n=1 Tax=Metaclostridioides mangenotii TaxID=1540 RepID=A0ABS4ECU5_9FIRM|nr:hypothetical protein [Clostridioides mangenotii]MBP1855751.1 hypothetical protein [Clostridioides mangenotii]